MDADTPRPARRSRDGQRYAQAMPQYEEQLDFLQRILDFQASLAEKVKSDVHIERAVAREKWRAGRPLFADEPLSIPSMVFLEALVDLRPLLPAGEEAQLALDRLLASSFVRPSTVGALLDDLITDGDACIQRLADATSTAPDVLTLLLRIALSPFFEKQATPYREWIETAAWRHGICPVCGSEPWMARLASEDGRRILVCSLCRTDWTFDRLRCPFCECHDQLQLRHFTVEGDEARRVDCCDQCQRYIKTVDERVSGRLANLLVEGVITAHLDALARELGYQ
jgi:formate dehydrogenase maturation protein FdhE